MEDSKTIEKSIRKMRGMLKKFLKKDRLVILLLIGVLLLVISMPVSESREGGILAKSKENAEMEHTELSLTDMDAYSEVLEEKLARMLSKIEGAGEVSAMITWKSSAERIVEKDEESTSESIEEQDSQGGSRITKHITSSDSAIYEKSDNSHQQEAPYVTKEMSPAVEGVIVIAQGGGNPVVVQQITEAIQALFSIDTHKIKVIKGNL